MILSLVSAEGVHPVTLSEARAHLRVDADTAQDALIAMMIGAAVDVFEGETGRQIGEATYDLHLSAFPRRGQPIEIPRPPLRSVVSVAYGEDIQWDGPFSVIAPQGPYAGTGAITADSWPTTSGPVVVRFTAGYAEGQIPDAIRLRILMLVADFYENRETQIVGSITAENRLVEQIVAPFRLPVLV
jgi:uncharacterized phiE125 gp8 family phage protein